MRLGLIASKNWNTKLAYLARASFLRRVWRRAHFELSIAALLLQARRVDRVAVRPRVSVHLGERP